MIDKMKRLITALLLTLPFTFLSYFVAGIIFLNGKDTLRSIALISAYVLINFMFFMSFYTRKTDKFRSFLFIAIAVTFPVEFILGLFEMRGHLMVATFSDMIAGNVPFCHIVIPQTILPLLFKGQIVFPGTIDAFAYSAGYMIVFWIAASLLLGKGWCSWVCFFGGWEEGCSRMAKKPRIKLSPKIVWGAAAVLLIVILTTIEFATPTYCLWLCPFKACSEFIEVGSPLVVIQTIIFIVLFIGLVIILPFLSKKRTQCMVLCPFGAMQSVVDKINPFDIRIDKKNCISCKKCIKECPVMAVSEKSLESGKVGFTCTKCGKCMDACPKKAIHFHIKGTPIGGKIGRITRVIFLYLAYTIIAGMGSGFIASAIQRLLLFITTGSFLYS